MADSIKFTNKYIDCTGVWDSTLSKTQAAINAQKLDIANIVNNFTTTTTGTYALDAAAGKTLNDSLGTLSTRVTSLDWYILYSEHAVRNTSTLLTVQYSRKFSDYSLIMFVYRDSGKTYVRASGIIPLTLWTVSKWEGTYVNTTGTQHWVDCSRSNDTEFRVQGSDSAAGGYFDLYGIKLHTTE